MRKSLVLRGAGAAIWKGGRCLAARLAPLGGKSCRKDAKRGGYLVVVVRVSEEEVMGAEG